jgi:hypothetical protein
VNLALTAVAARPTYTQRVKIDAASKRTSLVYAAAVKKAETDIDVARDVAPSRHCSRSAHVPTRPS